LIVSHRKSHFTVLIILPDSRNATTAQFHIFISSGINWTNICESKKFASIIMIIGLTINNIIMTINNDTIFNMCLFLLFWFWCGVHTSVLWIVRRGSEPVPYHVRCGAFSRSFDWQFEQLWVGLINHIQTGCQLSAPAGLEYSFGDCCV
jgi:hypothetical protein